MHTGAKNEFIHVDEAIERARRALAAYRAAAASSGHDDDSDNDNGQDSRQDE